MCFVYRNLCFVKAKILGLKPEALANVNPFRFFARAF